MSEEVLTGSLLTLSALLHKHYGKKVIVLIDEYDVPLSKANEKGYYDQMVSLIRSMFSRVLKTNSSLYFAVMTGCLRVAKESIFTGLNNIKVLSVTDVRFDEYSVLPMTKYGNFWIITGCPATMRQSGNGMTDITSETLTFYCPWM